MSDTVKLSAALPGHEDTNGLDHLAGRLTKDLTTTVVAIAFFDVQKVTETVDEHGNITRVPTVRLRKVEPVGESRETRERVADLYSELNEARRGMSPLPFDQLDGRTEHVEVLNGDDNQDGE